MTRRRRRVRPDSLGLEERVVLSGSGAASAAVASAGAPASNLAALAAFGEQARQGLTPTLTVRFGEATASAGTLVLPDASYSAGLGYGWLSNPGKITIRDGVATGRSGDFELDVPPGTYDVTVTPAASRDRGLDSQVTAFAAGDTLGGPGAFFSEPPHAMTLRTTVLQAGAGNGLIVALNQGFAVRSIQVVPVPNAGPAALFTSIQPATAPGTGLDVSLSGRQVSIGGTAEAPVLLPESGTITFDPQDGAPLEPSANSPHNWALDFTRAAQQGIPNAPANNPTVGGIISAISNVSIRNTGGTLDINTPNGRVELVVHGPADTAVPFSDLTSSVALTYKVHGGTGVYRDAEGTGTVDVNLTLADQSVEGTVTGGAVDPSAAEGSLTLTFHAGQ